MVAFPPRRRAGRFRAAAWPEGGSIRPVSLAGVGGGDVARSGKKPVRRRHHSVYVVYLRDPKGDGRAGYYVGMTGLTPEERFANHKAGIKSATVVKRFGVRLVPRLYQDLNPMSYEDAVAAEPRLAEELRARGYQVFGGH
jgi:hypothetical protein